jgi:hypothetical protein
MILFLVLLLLLRAVQAAHLLGLAALVVQEGALVAVGQIAVEQQQVVKAIMAALQLVLVRWAVLVAVAQAQWVQSQVHRVPVLTVRLAVLARHLP